MLYIRCEVLNERVRILIADNGSGAALTKAQCNVGQEVFFEYVDGFGANRTYRGNITAMAIVGNTNEVTLSSTVPDWVAQPSNIDIKFKEINDFSNIPAAYIDDEVD